MKYALDTEFIDTPTCSALISIGIVREDGESIYREFEHPAGEITPWLRENVVPYLSGGTVSFAEAAADITGWMNDDKPEVWCYFGAYDWYWFCRLFGGMMNMPDGFPHRFRELAEIKYSKPVAVGAQHHALADARGIMNSVRGKVSAFPSNANEPA